ncbi:HET-domain-containing protein, partial [Periconia macrospinosa]
MIANMPLAPQIYQPLAHRGEIRLLRMKPGTNEEPIEIHLKTAKLDSKTQYTALSYVWGDSSPPFLVKCDGHNFPVTHNLWEILSRFHQDRFEGLLWIDAICINQQDNKEKGVQVSMMREIYKQASKVIFWLGKQERYDEFAVDLMTLFKKRHEPFSELQPWRDKPLHELGLPSEHPGWLGWASLLCRPWFSRVWIVQEFL